MTEHKHTEDGLPTTGHEWDGIREYDKPLPRWWLYLLFGTMIWAVGYCIVYPAIPLWDGASRGSFGWSSRSELAAELRAVDAGRADILAAIEATPIEQIPQNEKLMSFAVEGGRSAFKVYCAQCHGSGAAGGKGYPNLNDDDWLWGGDLTAIHQTIRHGIRFEADGDTHMSQMPAFGRDGLLDASQIRDVTAFVRVLSRQEKPSDSSRRGAAVFADNCVSCHGAAGEGMREVGAPNLTDAIWLYGGDTASIMETVTNARFGVMPAWGGRLEPVTVKQLAVYVHSLGGGE
ncbi:cytochrome-c oxidase, cbb3-type subunit III [Pedomonas mirosovicensis]|uniref:cytochrome-c oxidase, cbb3-type subunit III n=1 Tax=Pedomonas mirosovicensis TaxID=2908641 RepID=UPI002168C069|nr:cytochrome-c oxidase, cbb3-type subunit III [Pedomonas mirosovicensis]MCH8686245.1 cytochrome-c oxidase, cbb3-type subunit III [Pedomonas mirosovicensis]